MRKNLLRWGIGLLTLSALGFVLIFAGGCQHQAVTNVPTGVTVNQVQAWDSAVKDLATIATLTHTAQQLVQTLHSSTVTVNGATSVVFPSGAAYTATVTDLAKIDQAQIEASEFLKTVPQNWGASTKTQIANYITAIMAALADATANGVTGISNSSAQAQLSQFLADIASTANLISQL
jgi:hypothetical protein